MRWASSRIDRRTIAVQGVVVGADPERRAGRDEVAVLAGRAASPRRSSGAVRTRAWSWFSAWVRALRALRCTIFNARNASTGPSWDFGVAVASPDCTARAGGDRVDDIGLAVPAADLPVRSTDLDHA